jgi:hypothetical protein
MAFCALFVACSASGGPGGGSEEVSAGEGVLLVGGPGGSNAQEIDPEVADRLPSSLQGCPATVRAWDRSLIEGNFEAVLVETSVEPESPALRPMAQLYNSLGRLYSGGDPARALTDLDRLAADDAGLALCGNKGPALLSEGSMFASAALGDFARAERHLAAVAELAPGAESGLARQLDELQEVVESPTPETSTPESPLPTESPTPSVTSTS